MLPGLEKTKDGLQDRLLTLAAIYDGATRAQAAKIGDVGLQSIWDWVLRFNGRGPEGPVAARLERDFKQVEATRDQLAAEFSAKVVAELVDLLSRTSDCDPECSRIDRAATAGERRRLLAVELHARRASASQNASQIKDVHARA